MRISGDKVVMERVNNRTAVKLDKLLPQYLIHPLHICSMGPVGIVDTCERNSLLSAIKRSQHHVR